MEIGGIRFEVKHSDSGEVNLMLIAKDPDGNTDAFPFTMDRRRNLSDEEAERDIHFFKLVLKQGTMQQDFHIANRKDGVMSLRQWMGSESVDSDENEYSFKPPKGYMDSDYKTTVANCIENMQLSWEDKQYTVDVIEVYLDGYVARGTWEFMGQKGVAYITTN